MIENLLKLAQWIAVGSPCVVPEGETPTLWCVLQNVLLFVIRLATIVVLYYVMRDVIGAGIAQLTAISSAVLYGKGL